MLLLDEPTSGLDPASARHIRDLILGLRSEGRAILVSTHNLGEAEELVRSHRASSRPICSPSTRRRRLRSGAGGQPRRDRARGRERASEFAIDDVAEIPAIVARLVGEGARIVRVTPDQRSLEDVYLDLVGAER